MNKNRFRKNRHRSLLLLLSVAGLVAILISLYLLFRNSNPSKNTTFHVPLMKTLIGTKTKLVHNYGSPVRLSIPKLKIDATVISVGIAKDGNLDTPRNSIDVGWYEYGPYPGNKGSSVINGHVGVGSSAVFTNLDQLQIGDNLTVLDSNNHVVSFIVRSIKTYGRNEKTPEVFSSTSGSHLNLITCTGDWVSNQKTYSNRLVIFTDRLN